MNNVGIAVLIPIYNETPIVERLYSQLEKLLLRYNLKLLLVDDGSTDNFTNAIRSFNNNNVLTYSHKTNLGYGAAVRSGLTYLKSQNIDFAIIADSDMSSSVQEIEKLVNFILDTNEISNFHYIKPSRFLNDDSGMIGVKRSRSVATKLANVVSRILTNFRISDPTNGFRALNLKIFDFTQTQSNGFDSITEELKIAITKGYRIEQIPTILNHRDSLRVTTSFQYTPKLILGYLSHLVDIFSFSNKRTVNFVSNLLVFAFSFFWAKYTIQNFELRLAQISSDDGIISHVLSWARPEDFKGDPRATIFSSEIWASGINWIPALFYEYLKIDPIFFHKLFSFLQNFLLPISIYYFVKIILNRILLSWLITISILNFRPFLMNNSWFGDLEWMPYSAWFSVPLFIFSISFLYRNKIGSFLFFYSLVAIVHPVVGLCLFAISTVYVILSKSVIKKTITLLSISIIMMGVFVFIKIMTPENMLPKSATQILSIFGNTHGKSFFFNIETSISDPSNLFYFYWIITLILFIYLRTFIDSELKYLFISINTVSFMFILFHGLFYLVKFEDGFVLILSRITYLTSLMNLIILMCMVSLSVNFKKISNTFVSYFWVLVPSPLLSIILVFIKSILNGRLVRKRAYLILLLLMYIYYKLNTTILINVKNLFVALFNLEFVNSINILYDTIASDLIFQQFKFNKLYFLGLFLICFFASVIWIKDWMKWKILNSIALIFCIFLSINLLKARELNFNFRDYEYTQNLYDVQNWARFNTPVGTCFVAEKHDIYAAWRNVSRRPVRIPTRQSGFYNTTDYAENYNTLINEFLIRNKNVDIQNRSEDFYLDFSSKFDCGVLVWRTEWGNLAFRKLYFNRDFMVYKIG